MRKQQTKIKKEKLSLTIGHLYADLMNIYGDNGNIITLRQRCAWRGIEVKVLNISLKEAIKPGVVDLYFFGGGQDQAQGLIADDLLNVIKAEAIKSDIERGVPLLSVCGGYQLLGEYYAPHKGEKLMGLGIFPAYTEASHERMIGNIVIEMTNDELRMTNEKQHIHPIPPPMARLAFGGLTLNAKPLLVGFENHSGKTFLRENAEPLGTVVSGFGNNGEDSTEGCVYKNAVGCYMHGSLLPKNPQFADWLISRALAVKYGKEIKLEMIHDGLEMEAHDFAVAKFTS